VRDLTAAGSVAQPQYRHVTVAKLRHLAVESPVLADPGIPEALK